MFRQEFHNLVTHWLNFKNHSTLQIYLTSANLSHHTNEGGIHWSFLGQTLCRRGVWIVFHFIFRYICMTFN